MGKGQARKVCVGVWETDTTHTHKQTGKEKNTERGKAYFF